MEKSIKIEKTPEGAVKIDKNTIKAHVRREKFYICETLYFMS